MVIRRSWLIFAALFAIAAWVFWPRASEEDRVRAVVNAVAAGAETGDVGDIMDHVSARYRGSEQGFGMDERTLRAGLALQFMRRGPIGVVLSPIDVTVSGATAHARFDAAVLEGGGKWSELLPRSGDGWHLEVDLDREEDGEWRVTGHTRTSWIRTPTP